MRATDWQDVFGQFNLNFLQNTYFGIQWPKTFSPLIVLADLIEFWKEILKSSRKQTTLKWRGLENEKPTSWSSVSDGEIRENLKIMGSKSWRNCPLVIPASDENNFKLLTMMITDFLSYLAMQIWRNQLQQMTSSKLKTFYHDVTTVAYIMSAAIITEVKKVTFPARNTDRAAEVEFLLFSPD